MKDAIFLNRTECPICQAEPLTFKKQSQSFKSGSGIVRGDAGARRNDDLLKRHSQVYPFVDSGENGHGRGVNVRYLNYLFDSIASNAYIDVTIYGKEVTQ